MSLISTYRKVRNLGNGHLESLKVALRKMKWKNIYAHSSFKIIGADKIQVDDLWLGLHYRGFERCSDQGLINVQGELKIQGHYKIGKGCRLDIGKDATVEIGKNGYINSNTKLIISEGLTIGENTVVSWDCQFLDNDFHTIEIDGKSKVKAQPITIGNHVWIGCGAKIYKGVTIPDNCVVASDAVVKGSFTEENCLIAGNPAKVVKTDVNWE
jgi:acetyltransferase-like isoleucine patch superfamily enzyme